MAEPVMSGEGLGLSVLVVEDDALLLMMLEDALAGLGCSVQAVTTVGEALEAARGPDIEVGLLDINVAGQPVYPVADILRERGVPFFFVTAYVDIGVSASYAEVPRLHKPFRLADLETLLRRVAAERAARRPAPRG